MTNLPEQAHQQSTAVAIQSSVDPYAMDQSMITLPTLLIAQYQSKAFKRHLAEYGDLFVGVGSDDPAPVVVAKGGEPLGEPVRLYVHRVQSGFDTAEDPTDLKRKTLGRAGGTFQEALAKVGGDPRRVWQKFVYQLTVPVFPDFPVRFYASGMTARSARWLNSQISMIAMKGTNQDVLETAFQLQTRPSHNDQGDFALGEFGFADVKAKDRATDEEIVQRHADLLATATIADAEPYIEGDAEPDAANAPSLS